MANFGHFSLVKSAKNKIAFLQQKECSIQKIEENKSDLESNLPSKFKCASLNFEIWVFGANLTEPYWLAVPARAPVQAENPSTKLCAIWHL